MKRIEILAILVLTGIIVVLVLGTLRSESNYKTINVLNTTLTAEIADTPEERTTGLIFKKSLADNQAMLFIFDDEGYHAMWMMNMSFSIDILWISEDLRIVDMVNDAPPCDDNCPVYTPKEKALYILEANSRFIESNRIKVGDPIQIS